MKPIWIISIFILFILVSTPIIAEDNKTNDTKGIDDKGLGEDDGLGGGLLGAPPGGTLTWLAESSSYANHLPGLDVDDTYVYTGGYNQRVVKLLQTDLSFVAQSAALGKNLWDVAVGYEYVFGGTTDGFVYQFWISNMTTRTSISGIGEIMAMETDEDGYLYVATRGAKSVIKYYQSNLTEVTSTGNIGRFYDLEWKDGYLYGAGWFTIKEVVKWYSSNLTEVWRTAKNEQFYGVTKLDDYIFGINYQGAATALFKWYDSNGTYVDNVTLGGGGYYVSSDAYYVYPACYDSKLIYQIYPNNLTERGRTPTNESWRKCVNKGEYLFGSGSGTFKVFKYDSHLPEPTVTLLSPVNESTGVCPGYVTFGIKLEHEHPGALMDVNYIINDTFGFADVYYWVDLPEGTHELVLPVVHYNFNYSWYVTVYDEVFAVDSNINFFTTALNADECTASSVSASYAWVAGVALACGSLGILAYIDNKKRRYRND